jgi:hypothetical protein
MSLEQLTAGVLRVMTPLGPRYLQLSFVQRLYLLWVFRHFQTLPVSVLSSRQLRVVEALCEKNGFVALGGVALDTPLVGTLEQRPPIPETPPRRPSASVTDSVMPLAANARRQ